jgi:membrane carboxypeptidase/penicillin-binding protein
MTDIIILALVLIFSAYYLLKHHRLPDTESLKAVREIFFDLVLRAEATFGGQTGQAKRAFVVSKFYEVVPDELRRMFKPQKVMELVENAVTRMKEYFLKNPEAERRIIGE